MCIGTGETQTVTERRRTNTLRSTGPRNGSTDKNWDALKCAHSSRDRNRHFKLFLPCLYMHAFQELKNCRSSTSQQLIKILVSNIWIQDKGTLQRNMRYSASFCAGFIISPLRTLLQCPLRCRGVFPLTSLGSEPRPKASLLCFGHLFVFDL